MTIQEYFEDWSAVIDLSEADRLKRKLSASKAIICPLPKNIFKAFHLCPYNKLKVVILAQDPYPTLKSIVLNGSSIKTPIATGLAFANTSDTPPSSYSPSLEVLKESVIDFTIPHRTVTFDPSLEKWAAQGVLLLNSALSCEAGKIGSHTLLWRPFIKSLLINLSRCQTGIVYLLMGSDAQSFEPFINKKFNYIRRIRHPSWYHRQHEPMPSGIWRDINTIIKGQSGSTIQWYEEY